MNEITKPLPPLVRQSAGPAPVRVPGSVRRTSSIDVSWPNGHGGGMHLIGRARDIFTPRDSGVAVVLAEDSYDAVLKMDRSIVSITTSPERPKLARLVGQRGGGHLREVLKEVAPEERINGTPMYLILDDISGTSLVANWGWAKWNPEWFASMRGNMSEEQWAKMMKDREGVCIGFAPGASELNPGDSNRQMGAPVVDLRNPADLDGWHKFTDQDGKIGFRRARRIDVWRDNDIVIDAAFQDSATAPEGGRAAVHEYSLRATADAASMRLTSIQATPRILPKPECPSATLTIAKLVGTPLPDLRDKVLAEFKGVAGCTHLNDAMRALAEVPALVKHLP